MSRSGSAALSRTYSSVAVVVALTGACAPARGPRAYTAGEAFELPPPSHAVDSTGDVDNAGLTSDQRGRTELSGMRPTETGSQVPTGTPGSGFPLPIEPRALPRPPEGPVPGEIAIGPVTDDGTVTKAVLEAVRIAYCEREERCGRSGEEEARRCTAAFSGRYREELGAAACPFSFDVDSVVACLSAIRGTPCDVSLEEISVLDRCYAPAMCLPR